MSVSTRSTVYTTDVPVPQGIRGGTRLLLVVLLLLFWAISLWNLDRFPFPYYDEGIIIAPGWKLVTEGVYGMDPYTGHYNAERLHLEFMPLESLLQGVLLRIVGLGLFQARVIAASAGLILLALTYRMAAQLFNAQVGLWTLIMLLTWQIQPTRLPLNGTGIPIIDLARLVRYDMLAAMWGLASFWCFVHARKTQQLRFYFLCGLLVGLAGLAHVYGLFWGCGFAAVLLLEGRRNTSDSLATTLAVLAAGTLIVVLPWITLLALNWTNARGHLNINPDRYDLLNLKFYLLNVYHEPRRYGLSLDDLTNAQNYLRAGFWLTAIGAPAAMIWLTVQGWRSRNRQALWFVVVSILVMGLFALLIQPKIQLYLPTTAPLLAMAMSAFGYALWNARQRWIRVALAAILTVSVAQAAYLIGSLHAYAASLPAADDIFAQLRQFVPPDQRVLAMPNYWFVRPEPGFRFASLAVFMTTPAHTHVPISPREVLMHIAPDYVVIDHLMKLMFRLEETPDPNSLGQVFLDYMEEHDATLVGTVLDSSGMPIEVYRLRQPQPVSQP